MKRTDYELECIIEKVLRTGGYIFPETEEEVELFEKLFPAPVELPERLRNWPLKSLLLMGNFRIVINAVGNHGQDRSKVDGETVDFTDGNTSNQTPESIMERAVQELRAWGTTVESAKVYHWPAADDSLPKDNQGNECITDDLITGIRKGNF